MLGAVSDGVLSLDCVVIVDELVMEVLLIFALEYVAEAIWVDLNGSGIAIKQNSCISIASISNKIYRATWLQIW